MEREAAPANLLAEAISGDPQRQRRQRADVAQIIDLAEQFQGRPSVVAQGIDDNCQQP